jgi:CubicO group peptidase (beta-lactamase class C family)
MFKFIKKAKSTTIAALLIFAIIASVSFYYLYVAEKDTTKELVNSSNVKEKLNTTTDEKNSEFDEKILKLLEKFKVSGAVVALVDNGKVSYIKGFGYSDIQNKIPMRTDSVFQVASISKPVTAWGVMKLVEEGKIKLNDPVEKYIKRWHFPESKFDSKEVTIQRLLNHTAGLSVSSYPGLEPDKVLPSIEESLNGYPPLVQPLNIINEPGSAWKYAGSGYTLLQLLIEEVSGESFESYMQKVVLEPLGMKESTFDYNKVNQEMLCKAYDENGESVLNYLFTEKAAAGLYTTAPDLAKFVAASLAGPNNETPGRNILSEDTVSKMFTATEESKGIWGLGYQITFKYTLTEQDKVSHNTRDAILHSGANYGWKAIILANTKSNKGIVILTNSDNGTDFMVELAKMWDKGRY